MTQLGEGPLDLGLFSSQTAFAKLNISTVIRLQVCQSNGAWLGTVSKRASLAFSAELAWYVASCEWRGLSDRSSPVVNLAEVGDARFQESVVGIGQGTGIDPISTFDQ